MAQTLTASFGNGLRVSETFNTGPASSVADSSIVPGITFVAGNAAAALGINASFLKCVNSVTLNSGASVTYTLTNMTDDTARTISMAGGVRFVMIAVTSRTAGDYLTVGQAATNPWTSPFVGTTPGLKVWDLAVLGVGSTDKYAVAAGSNEQLKITNSGSNPITFKPALLGCAS